jgi:hypothetical protein
MYRLEHVLTILCVVKERPRFARGAERSECLHVVCPDVVEDVLRSERPKVLGVGYAIEFSDVLKDLGRVICEGENLLIFLKIGLPLILVLELGDVIKVIDLVVWRLKGSIDTSFDTKHNVEDKVELI